MFEDFTQSADYVVNSVLRSIKVFLRFINSKRIFGSLLSKWHIHASQKEVTVFTDIKVSTFEMCF